MISIIIDKCKCNIVTQVSHNMSEDIIIKYCPFCGRKLK